MEHDRGFLLGWRTGTLWLIPILAVLFFAWVVTVFFNPRLTPNVALETWMRIGIGVFAVLFLVELLLLIRRGPKAAEAEAGPDEVEASAEIPPAYAPPSAGAPRVEAEVRLTGEQYRGMNVLEVSIPPKSRNRGAVYAKSFVPVTGELVLRIEDLVADRADVAPVTPTA